MRASEREREQRQELELAVAEDPRAIRFGTDGWRGVIGHSFTFSNVGRVAQAIAAFLRSPQRRELRLYREWGVPCRPPEAGVVVGYDTRFLSREFAAFLGGVLEASGIPARVSAEPVPTPALSYAVVQREAALGVMITSSHNPFYYNGIKLKPEFGGSAPPEVTQLVEKLLPQSFSTEAQGEPEVEEVDLKGPYLARIKELIDLRALQAAPLRVVVDAMYGSAQGYVSQILEELGVPYVAIRSRQDAHFGGKRPEPILANLGPLRAVIAAERKRLRRGQLLVGVVTDGDGDRVAAMDEEGNLIDAHRAYALIFRHLLRKGLRGVAVKSVSLTDMVEKIAKKYDVKVEETPVGFKYIVEKMIREDALIGGEESGGIGIKGHIPERDGVLNSLLLLEIVAQERKPLSAIVNDLMQEIGYHYYDRRDLHLEERHEVVELLQKKKPARFAGRRVVAIETLDGVKLRFADGWLLFRASGTEPLLRLYCEMDRPEKVREVLDEAERYVRGELRLW